MQRKNSKELEVVWLEVELQPKTMTSILQKSSLWLRHLILQYRGSRFQRRGFFYHSEQQTYLAAIHSARDKQRKFYGP